jgi:hypothetical protein
MATQKRTPGSKTPTPSPAPAEHKGFDWPLAYEAERFLRQRLDAFLSLNSFARQLAGRMREETGTDVFEWVDHLVLAPADEPALLGAGFALDCEADAPRGDLVFEHPLATLPRVLLRKSRQSPSVAAIKPEFVADFIARHNLRSKTEGEPRSRYRRVVVAEENGTRLEAVERRAYRGFVPAPLERGELAPIIEVRELFQTRPRRLADDAEGFDIVQKLLNQAIRLVGRDVACHLFFEAERAYWESRNHAGRLQKFRQDALGLGWGNHDHHTFRSSREHFANLIQALVKLGFQKRERFYAGAEAGWGAQVLEQPVTGIVVFADVDLLPDETTLDFSTRKLPHAPKLGTVGLWVGLHGESLLDAGMHHLEARFDFDTLRGQLQREGVNTMKPFSDFAFLRQAFTEGERWPVRQERAAQLVRQGLLTPEQADSFVRDGAIGSHLENLQRHGGFKGFNQKAVSAIIAATDPRKQNRAHAGT